MIDRPQYHWRIRVDYLSGNHQSWPCDSEPLARQEFDHYRQLLQNGQLTDVLSIRLERQPIADWETVRIAPEEPTP
jgi:hypothetical protein